MYCIVLNNRLSLIPDERNCPEKMNENKSLELFGRINKNATGAV
jgi:hypothetical protein